MDEELIMRAQAIEQKAQEIEQNLQIVNEQLDELRKFKDSLNEIDKNDEKEMLSLIGKGVYAKTELKEKELFVNVGADIYVKKSAKETVKVIHEQLQRLSEAKIQLVNRMESYGAAFQEILEEIRKSQEK